MKENQQVRSLIETYLPAPNPIYDKGQLFIDESVNIRFLKQIFYLQHCDMNRPNISLEDDQDLFDTNDHPVRSILNYFDESKHRLIYQKYNNQTWATIPLNNLRFVSSIFYDIKKLYMLNLKSPLLAQHDLLSSLHQNFLPSIRSKIQPIQQEQEGKGYRGLKFNSNFESGNLFAVFKVGEKEYDLILQNDTNSKGNTQWFYFSTQNTTSGQNVRFNVINFLKNDSLFNYGQQPVFYSTKNAEKGQNSQWQKCGSHLKYYSNKFIKENSQTKTYHSLSFTFKFEFSGDTVFFAQCYPYTYQNLIKKIEAYEQNPQIKKYIQVKELCKSIGQLSVPYIFLKSGNIKPNIVIMARQHPGETPGSYMMDGVMDLILGETIESQILRSTYNIYMVPMVNPDGVVHGNYRCNLNGVDLNRIWHCPNRDFHDSVYHIKELVKSLNKNGGVSLILDLHGHSKKFNSFFYGNPTQTQINARILPFISSKINTSISFVDSSFSLSESKRKTARVALQSEINGMCYTFETSFHGHQKDGFHGTFAYNQAAYQQLGKDIILAYFHTAKHFQQFQNNQLLQGYIPSHIPKEKEIEIEEYIKDVIQDDDMLVIVQENDSSGSESNPEEGTLIELETQSIQVSLRNKSLDDSQISQRKSINRKLKKRTRLDKYTQSDSNQFQSLMLDPDILKNVEQQLTVLRQNTNKGNSNREDVKIHNTKMEDNLKGFSNRENNFKGFNKKEDTMRSSSDYQDNQEELNQDILHKYMLPIHINGFQFKQSVKKVNLGNQYVYNFTRINQPKQLFSSVQFNDVQCQTDISLQQILGKVHIYQIKLQQNQIFKSSFPYQKEGIGKQIKPLIILLSPSKSSNNQSYRKASSLIDNFSVLVQPQIANGNFTSKNQTTIQNFNKTSFNKFGFTQIDGFNESVQVSKTLQPAQNSGSQRVMYKETEVVQQQVRTIDPIKNKFRRSSVNQSPNKFIQSRQSRKESLNFEQETLQCPSFMLVNEKFLKHKRQLNQNKHETNFRGGTVINLSLQSSFQK